MPFPLDAAGVSLSFGPRTLLHDVRVQLAAGDRVALVGPNGSGKTTLLRILAGADPAPPGARVRRAPGAQVAYLPQVTEDAPSVRALLRARTGVAEAEAAMDGLAARLTDGDLEAVEPHGAALERWLALGGDDLAARLPGAVARVGLAPELLDRATRSLSGGQRARAGLAALALARHDVLLLDEPTNHLDADGLATLRAILGEAPGAVVVVSHDRAFLAGMARRVLHLERGELTAYAGGWAVYEHERDAARRLARETYGGAVAERERLRAVEARRQAEAARGVRRARTRTDEADKNIRRLNIESAQNGMGAFSRRSEQVEVPEKPWEEAASKLLLRAAHGGDGVALVSATVRAGSFAIGPLDLAVAPGERVLLAGPNGSGKSTVLGALAGRTPLAGGRRAGGRVAELGQYRGALAPGRPVVASLRAAAGLGETEARAALAAVRLGPEVAARPTEMLSPGERTRAELALLAHRGAACLLLDEPTNHLDLDALEVLEAALRGWTGGLVVATHDARLRDAVAIARVEDVRRWHPRSMPPDLEFVRRVALDLPETTEQDHHGRPSFRVRGKIFATLHVPHERAMLKLPRAEQLALAEARPDVYAPVPGTWGERGSTLVELPGAEAAELAELIEEAWRGVAPKGLVAALDDTREAG